MPTLQATGGAEHRPASPAILLFDENGNCTRANDQAARITSTGRDELVGVTAQVGCGLVEIWCCGD